ncbi:hypothetical protein ANO14919_119800 [Xylariales sp. No.14919]|nr:hypothetical protein ANO14919_119800 [Xylariales sp. No.14919]
MLDPMDNIVTALWDQAVLQLDAHTNSRNIKLSSNTFHTLGITGEQYFKQQASLLLNGPAEFYTDASNNNRFYLGISTEFVQQFGFTIQQSLGNRLPALFPPSGQPIIGMPPSQPASALQHAAPSFQMSSSEFNYKTPTCAPQYPISSPEPLGTMCSTPGPSSALKRTISMVNAINVQPLQGWIPTNAHPHNSPDGENENREDDDNDDEDYSEENHIKRPPNSWILFRQAHHAIIMQQYPKIHNSQVSKIISAKWKSMSKVEKKPWFDLAVVKAEEHKQLHPGYKYKPNMKKSKAGAKRAKTKDQAPSADSMEFFNMDIYQNIPGQNPAAQAFVPPGAAEQTGPPGASAENGNNQNLADQIFALNVTPDGAQNSDDQNLLGPAFAPQMAPDQAALNYNDTQNAFCLPQMNEQEQQPYHLGGFSDAVPYPQGVGEFIAPFETQFLNFN